MKTSLSSVVHLQATVAVFENMSGDKIPRRVGEYLFGGFVVEEISPKQSGLSGYVVLLDQASGKQVVIEAGDDFYPEDYH